MIDVRLRQHFASSAESAAFTLEVEFHAGPGSTVLFGPSGAGKTLTLDAIAGFRRPAEGHIAVAGAVLFDAARGIDLPPRSRQCGYVFQNYALFPHMTLRENLEFAAARSPRLERHRRVVEMLERFRLGEVAGRRPHELSGGQKQRCSIARALLTNPRVLLLDEPARGLDAALRQELYTVLRQVRAEFATPMLAVTHDADECFELGDEMVVLDHGKVAQVGAPRKVVDQPANLGVARQFGFYNLLPVEIRALDPTRDSSVVRFVDVDLTGPYFPGRFIGDRVTLFVRTSLTGASPRNGRPGPNQVPVTLERASERPGAVRLEFSSGIVAEVSRMEFDRGRHTKDWVVEFPQPLIRVI